MPAGLTYYDGDVFVGVKEECAAGQRGSAAPGDSPLGLLGPGAGAGQVAPEENKK